MEKYIEVFGKNHSEILKYKQLLNKNQLNEAEKQRKFLNMAATFAKSGIYHIEKVD